MVLEVYSLVFVRVKSWLAWMICVVGMEMVGWGKGGNSTFSCYVLALLFPSSDAVFILIVAASNVLVHLTPISRKTEIIIFRVADA